jgi:hypothetical protein
MSRFFCGVRYVEVLGNTPMLQKNFVRENEKLFEGWGVGFEIP